MKIAHLVMSMDKYGGGVPPVVYNLCKSLKSNSLDVSIHCPYYNREIINHNDHTIVTHLYKAGKIFNINISLPLLELSKNNDIDILHSHGIWEFSSYVSNNWKRRTNKPLIITTHGMLDKWAINSSKIKKKIAGFFYENSNLKNADCIHAGSLSELKAIRQYGLKNPVCVIPNGIDVYKGEKIIPSWFNKLDNKKRKLLFLGRLHPKKGIMELIQAWSELIKRKDYKGDWELIIAGWDQLGYSHSIQKFIIENNLIESIHFIGPQFDEEKIGTFQNVDAFILPSFSEGFPISVLEAWSFRLPVLMTKYCNIPVGFEINAALELSPNKESIKENLISLFAMDQELLKGIGNNGYNLINKEFNWEIVGKKILEVYYWLLEDSTIPDTVFFK